MNELDHIRNKLQSIELPDIEHSWEKMSAMLSAEQVEANRVRIRKILLRLVGLNMFGGIVISLFAILPVNSNKQLSEKAEVLRLDREFVHVSISPELARHTEMAEAIQLPLNSLEPHNSEGIKPLPSSELRINGISYPSFEAKIDQPEYLSPLKAELNSHLKAIYCLKPYGFVTYGAFPEVRSADRLNQFGAMAGMRLSSNGYHSLDLNFEYVPVSIRTLDLNMVDVANPGYDLIRSYKRVNYLCAGIGVDQRLNRKVNISVGMQVGRVLSAYGSEALRESGSGAALKFKESSVWKNPEGIRRTDIALTASMEYRLKHGSALVRYRQSLRDHSLDDVFQSGTFNSYGIIQFGLGYNLNPK